MNIPMTGLLVLWAMKIITAKASPRYGAAAASKRAPDMKEGTKAIQIGTAALIPWRKRPLKSITLD